MHFILTALRENLVFLREAENFSPNCRLFRERWEQALKNEPWNREELLNIAADLYLDWKSYLVHWFLDQHIQAGTLTQAALNEAAAQMMTLLQNHANETYLEQVRQEAESIAGSNIRKMCEQVLDGRLATYWGHDYCSGLSHSLRRGACFATTNPAKINLFRKENPESWAQAVETVKQQHSGVSGEKLISYLIVKVAASIAQELQPIYEATQGRFGFVCVQVNPRNWQDSDRMTEEIEFWNEEFQKELNMAVPNIVYKIPAVRAAVSTVTRIIRQKLRVCLTLNFSFRQHDLFSDLLEQGEQPGFIVLMNGFLDDAAAKELVALGITKAQEYARHAGEAVIRKSYANLRAKGCKKSAILSAAIRGEWTISNALTAYDDSPMYLTTMAEKIQEYDQAARSLEPVVDIPVDPEILAVLRDSTSFVTAYDSDNVTWEQIEGLAPLQAVLGAFNIAYTEIEESLR